MAYTKWWIKQVRESGFLNGGFSMLPQHVDLITIVVKMKPESGVKASLSIDAWVAEISSIVL